MRKIFVQNVFKIDLNNLKLMFVIFFYCNYNLIYINKFDSNIINLYISINIKFGKKTIFYNVVAYDLVIRCNIEIFLLNLIILFLSIWL